ncbi:MAG: chloride channel protein [Deltaproteobacteria bacterium]
MIWDWRRAGRRLLAVSVDFRLTLVAGIVGIVAGLGAVVFRVLIGMFHNLFFFGTLSPDYHATIHTLESPWGVGIILVPVAGAVLVAFLVNNFAPEAKGHGVPEVMEAIYYRKSYIRPLVAVIKSLASAISIGTGGSIGREGPIIQIGSSLGSSLGQLLNLPTWQRYTLVSAGAGGGIAATFNTPIGGLLFAIELILPEVSARTIIPVSIATGAATFIGRFFLGATPSFNIPSLTLPAASQTSLAQFFAYILLGHLLGLFSVLFILSIYSFIDFFDRMPGSYYTRHMSGMLVVGVMMYLFMHFSGHYYIQGVGYATVQDLLTSTLRNPYFLFLLLFAKMLSTSLTLGSGGSGGIFSPLLFIGATMGGGFGLLVHDWFPLLHLNVQGLVVVGMAGMVGGATGAVMTAVVMIFEMTRDYNVIIPLIITVSIAYGIRRLLLTDSIYTMKLSRRGYYVPQTPQTAGILPRTAGEIIAAPFVAANQGEDVTLLQQRIGKMKRYPYVLFRNKQAMEVLRPVGTNNGKKVKELKKIKYIVTGTDDVLFDVLAKLREAEAEAAVITPSGKLNGPEDVIGILGFEEIARGFRRS